jgi:hypothetical protein
MTNSAKHRFSSDAGIAPGSEAIVGADTGEAIQNPSRAPSRHGEARPFN